MKAACFTVAALDYFPQQNEHFAGGNSLNQAVRLRQAGVDTAFIGALGMDVAGERILDLLLRNGVDVSHTHRLPGKTATNRILNDEAGERYGVDDAWSGGVYETYLLSEGDWSYITGFEIWITHANNPNYREALKRKPASVFMGVDFLHFKDYELLRDSLDIIDVAYFGGTPDMADDLKRMSMGRRGIIVLTLGAEGSLAFVDGREYRQPALPVLKVTDTTGCGDAFQAAFSLSYFKDRDVEKALLAGAQGGKKATQHFGGVPWML